ncbi:ketoacyl-ACP synthase III [uncultured Fretibacterium sp.]|uniref:3-oxoacyl-ACP synthase III family protein n=1 Tax=uncultured Fretibacterium sp. TaxID=1678694 RepID=UPI00262A6EB4|nr:ketoacyl-ACP synthase III [uncultured Fretibacterium sp.]
MGHEAAVKAISVYLPEGVLDNAELVRQFGTWTENKIYGKTGVSERRVVGDEKVSDLAAAAGERLFEEHGIDRGSIDFLLLCTECPDYFLPATACIVQNRLGLRKDAGALDYNLGCSGFIYGLALAKGLVLGGVARRVLLITAETITRTIHPQDKSTRTLFGDAAAATLVESSAERGIGEFVLGTDGSGAERLIIPAGAWARPSSPETRVETKNKWGNVRTLENLYMDGPEILKFSMEVAPDCMNDTLERNGTSLEALRLVVLHQASHMMLVKLRELLAIPEEKFVFNIEKYGNTVSSTIPIALYDSMRSGRLGKGDSVLVMGFGVGLSWGGTVLHMS